MSTFSTVRALLDLVVADTNVSPAFAAVLADLAERSEEEPVAADDDREEQT